MLIKMILENSGVNERPLVKRFLRHLAAGAGMGLLLGTCAYMAILISMDEQSIQIPFLFGLAMLLQAAAVGGLVGGGVFMSRITDRNADNESGALEPDTDRPDGPSAD